MNAVVNMAYKGWPSGTSLPVLVVFVVAVLIVAALIGRAKRK
jgi:hypothetical protein